MSFAAVWLGKECWWCPVIASGCPHISGSGSLPAGITFLKRSCDWRSF